MSESHQAPIIRLEVDQEVYIDSVRDDDVIEDATVATEVTSFDRVGDAYILEGAIVFAGYMKRNPEEEQQPTLSADAETALVEHFHHRLPFWLRVPAKYQPRGIVNVASRIASWRLETISAGWVHVVSDLQITGLNGQSGYHFQCGAQEEGDLFFNQATVDEPAPAASISEAPTLEEDVDEDISFFSPHMAFADDETGLPAQMNDSESLKSEETEDEMVLTRGGGDPDLNHANIPSALSPDMQREFDAISMARGGLESADADSRDSSPVDALQSEPVQALPAYDRAFEGGLGSDALGVQTHEVEDTVDAETWREPVIAEFEIAHQLTPEQTAGDPLNVGDQPPWESFSASRSFNEDGFHATAGFYSAPLTVTVGSRQPDEPQREEVIELVDEPSERFVSEISSEINSGMWSFVDFNGPEASYCLRFLVVMDHDTLDSVADRAGCTTSDLLRVNRLSLEEVHPGQSLAVPSR